eukprot:CAMPEP_0119134422 /NCGR_PEP_ID=MMETSP1310-20130426/16850_1 /TAXON_ID=464262 /ORGANISM="Genus nov. species nov., Strain RCC2339" /LENGTH=78 /DNA_ID=CAMNT_0007125213 /DNA_START=149 /DNA_END=385 /DNA_ORIENTATION=-
MPHEVGAAFGVMMGLLMGGSIAFGAIHRAAFGRDPVVRRSKWDYFLDDRDRVIAQKRFEASEKKSLMGRLRHSNPIAE